MHLLPEAFEGIVTGRLDPSNLDLAHPTKDAAHYWLGIVITHLAYRNRGAGTAVLAALCNGLSGHVVADVYSKQGRALLERTGWVFVRTGNTRSTCSSSHMVIRVSTPPGLPVRKLAHFD
jgi:hypothetical protein